MGILAGRKCVITLGATRIRGISKHDLAITIKEIDATEYDPDNTWEKGELGFAKAKLTLSGFFRTDDVEQSSLRAKFIAREMVQDMKIYHDYDNGKYYAPDTATDSEAGFWITELKVSAAVQEMVKLDMTLVSNGPIAEY
jgi:hypothetical protein